MNGLNIARARAEKERASNHWQVILQLTPDGADKLARFTGSNVGRYLVISSDRQVVSAPRIRGRSLALAVGNLLRIWQIAPI